MRLRISCIVLGLGILALAGRPAQAADIKKPDGFPIPIVELRGSPTQIGQEYGAQLASDIHLLDDKYLKIYLTDDRVRLKALLMTAAFRGRMLPEHRGEIDALAAASKMNKHELSLFQCFLDLSSMMACSTIALPADASPDHVARFGRTLDFDSFNVADKHSVLLIYHPQGRYAFAAVGWPGMVGVLSGMNEYGLCLANMEVSRHGRVVAAGMPYILLYRTILERCRTVDEAIALLKSTTRQTANNLMLMDAQGHRAVAEITPQSVVVRRTDDQHALICTNHQRGQDADTPGRCTRYDYLHDAADSLFGSVDTDCLKDMLLHVSQGDHTMQSMVFEPADRVLILSVGKNAARLPYGRLDLKPYFAHDHDAALN